MTDSRLLVLHDGGAFAGTLEQTAGSTKLRYDDAWRRFDGGIALSLSLPLSSGEHVAPLVDTFLWGLLPDNEVVLERWGRQFQVSSRNPFKLLAHVGEDCPGAFQLVPPEREAAVRAERGGVQWLTLREVEERLASVRLDPSLTRSARDKGQFSLAGAQPKIALHRDGSRWGVPFGRVPTTHILKPPSDDFEGFAENEHYCLRLAQRVGLPVARSEVVRFGQEVAIVVERFDRARTSELAAASAALAATEAANVADPASSVRAVERAARATALASLARERPVLRLHQEDVCQALGVHPARKYQNEGGPSPKQVVELLRKTSSSVVADVHTFVSALVYHWVIGATDAHGKNYSLLHAARGQVRLAPLYDVASALPYPRLPQRKLKLAMSIGGEYAMHGISSRHFVKLAQELKLDEDDVFARSVRLAESVAENAGATADELRSAGLDSPVISPLTGAIQKRAVACLRRLRER